MCVYYTIIPTVYKLINAAGRFVKRFINSISFKLRRLVKTSKLFHSACILREDAFLCHKSAASHLHMSINKNISAALRSDQSAIVRSSILADRLSPEERRWLTMVLPLQIEKQGESGCVTKSHFLQSWWDLHAPNMKWFSLFRASSDKSFRLRASSIPSERQSIAVTEGNLTLI